MDAGKRLVLGEGSGSSSICFVGEAPGGQEERVGRPFYERAPAGGELTRQCRNIGLARSEVYITNVVKEHPPGDDISKFFRINRNGTVWESDKFKEYKTMLEAELRSRRDIINVFVPMGNTALWTLCGRTGITKLRGSILPGLFWPGMKCVPTIHPINAVGGEGSKRGEYMYTHYIRMDLKRAMREAKSKEISLPQRVLRTKPGFIETMTFLGSLYSLKEVAFDIEVMNEEVSCISFSTTPLMAYSIVFMSGGMEVFTPTQEAEIWLAIAKVLENPNVKKIGQNLTFDASFVFKKYGIRCVNMEDTMIAAGITAPDFPKGLDFLTSIHTREPYYKDEGKKWYKFGIGGEEKFFEYNAKDSAVAHEISPKLQLELMKQGNTETFYYQNKLIEILVYMATHGVRADVKSILELSKAAGEKIGTLTEQFKSMCGRDINPDSPAQVMEYFYDTLGHKPYIHKGRPSSNIFALIRLARAGVAEAEVLKNIRKWSKMKSTYYDMNISSDGRLRTSWNPIGTKTGRFSSSEDIFGEGSNLQNLPDAFKAFIIPDDNCILYNVDKSQAENRIVAYVAPEPTMIEAFETGIDVHARTASLLFKIPIEEVSDEPGSSPLGNGEQSVRFWGKKSNHELNYGIGYRTFSLICELPEKQGKFLVERYHAVYPGIRGRYHARIKQQLSTDRTITNLYGRKRIFFDRWGDGLFKDAYAQIPQSTVADEINQKGMIPLYFEPEYKETDLLLQTHDSITFQISLSIPWEKHASILIYLKKRLETPLQFHGTSFTIPVDTSMGLALNKKSLRKVRIENGTSAENLSAQLKEIYGSLRESKEQIFDQIQFMPELDDAD